MPVVLDGFDPAGWGSTMNLCRSCGLDFGSVSAFDSHRVGTHEYTLTEGLHREPPVEDGRRCLSSRELSERTDKHGVRVFNLNSRGAWSMSPYLKDVGTPENVTVLVPGGVAA